MDSQNPNLGRQPLLDFRIPEAKVLKSISKIIKANFPKATFIITAAGIFLQENNGSKSRNDPVTAILEIVLKREKFDNYLIPQIEGDGNICLGFNSSDLHAALERVSKTDALRMYILQHSPSFLYFDIINAKAMNTTTKFITLIQPEIGHVIPPEYEDHLPVAVANMEAFKKSTTDAKKISKSKILVSVQKRGVMFKNVGSTIRGLQDTFGEWLEGAQCIFSEELSIARIHSFAEMAGTGIKQIQIYSEPGKPIKFKADASTLGTVSLYLQPEGSV